jgi:hypothetical protein
MEQENYIIKRNGQPIGKELTQEEYFDMMLDLAQDFYENGAPDPAELTTEVVKKDDA